MGDGFDDDQKRAVNHAAGSLVLSAAAGSGKTRVLVTRYLKHLADGVPVKNLVAITFTEKAAREMRERIRGHAGRNPHLETAAIDTIHGYCTRLLRKYAVATKLPPDFEVLDESLAGMVRAESTTTVLRELLLGHLPTTDDLHELIVLFGWSNVVEAVEEFLHSPDAAAWQGFVAKTPEVIATDWRDRAKAFVPKCIAEALDGSPAIAALEEVKIANPEGRAKLESVVTELQRLRNEPAAVDTAALKEAAKVGNHHAGKKLYGAEHYPIVRDGFAAVREILESGGMADLAAAPENLAAAAAVSLRMAHVALHVEAAYARQKRDQSALDFHDLLVRTRDLLRDNAAVRAELQNQIQFLLIDELQDTDPLQMELVTLLLGERPGLFAVGDAKQSIYRFRGAEVELFERLRAGLPPESRLNLPRNYRSRPGILRFVNALCGNWFPGEAALVPVRVENAMASVEFLWVQAADEKSSADELRRAEAAAIAERIRELVAEPDPKFKPNEIVLLFRSMSNVSIYEEALRNREIDYYLVGGRAFFAQQEVYDLVNLLSAVDNPNDGLAIAGTLRSPFCSLSDDAVTALGFHEEGIWQGLLAGSDLVPPAEQDALIRARRLLTEWRAVKDSLPLARLLQKILADSGYDAALLFEPLGERKLANLWKLQDIARTFDARGLSLAEFIDHLREQVTRQPREEEAVTVPEEAGNVVRIMSVHQAKGLEFPCVFVPDLAAKTREHPGVVARWHRELGALVSIPSDSEEDEVGYPKWPWLLGYAMDKVADDAEALRLLYVACTRAADLLILSSGLTHNKDGELSLTGPWLKGLARVFDLESGNGPAAVTVRMRRN